VFSFIGGVPRTVSCLGDSLEAGLPPETLESLDEGLGECQDSLEEGRPSLEPGRAAGYTWDGTGEIRFDGTGISPPLTTACCN